MDDKIEKLIGLAAKTGRIWVSSDIYNEILSHCSESKVSNGRLHLRCTDIRENPFLPANTIMPVDESEPLISPSSLLGD